MIYILSKVLDLTAAGTALAVHSAAFAVSVSVGLRGSLFIVKKFGTR